ncbi:ABC transporter substrate-binding protein [Argonema antarcticum]|uniref:ABC transporter substrate-binding protein n=1 Tax=Argonema antarcticum TaxID=2942763 RepID=UPI0020112FAD|nr:ABC transporter substrate-binding protein [Argonema antarcticum]MCL1475127.1 ABC transporter substrate-binding protein [Argonema antarcticum A004/B2]
MLKPCLHWLSVTILCFSLLILSGCQASTGGNNVIHLTLWHNMNPPPSRDVFQKLVDKFNQNHTDIQVESLYTGQADQQMPKILTAVVGNAAPDMLWFGSQITGKLVELGAIKPLEDWLKSSPLKSEIVPSLFEEMVLDDRIWSIPFTTSNLAVFYRPSLFKAAGITKVPETWSELRQVAKKLTLDKNGDRQIDQHGIMLPLGKGEWTVFSWLPFMFSADGELLKDDRPNLVNPGAIAALQLWSDLLKDGSAMLSQPERGYEEDALIAGKIAMQIKGSWNVSFFDKLGIDFGVFPMPKANKKATIIGGANMFVMKTTPEREQASLKFLEYVLSEEFQTELSLKIGFLPINIKSRNSKIYREFVAKQPEMKVFLDQMNSARSRPIIAGYTRLSENLGRAIEETLLGHSPKEALQKAQDRLKLIWETQ